MKVPFTDTCAKRSLKCMELLLLFVMQPRVFLITSFRKGNEICLRYLPGANELLLLAEKSYSFPLTFTSENFRESPNSYDESLAHTLHNFEMSIFGCSSSQVFDGTIPLQFYCQWYCKYEVHFPSLSTAYSAETMHLRTLDGLYIIFIFMPGISWGVLSVLFCITLCTRCSKTGAHSQAGGRGLL